MTIWRIIKIILMALGILLTIIIIYGHYVGRKRFQVHQQNIYFSDLPNAFDGYRILQISDLHTGTFADGREQELTQIVNLALQQKCDLIVFTGDIVNRRSEELSTFVKTYSRLKAPDGVYSILGNHDYCTYARHKTFKARREDFTKVIDYHAKFGWHLLRNENVKIRRGKDSLCLIGVENWGEQPFPQYGDLNKACKGIEKGSFSVLLSHDPSHWRRQVVPNTNIQLTLSGHTHGGQFKVFGWSPTKWKYKEWSGTYVDGAQVLNVSEGAGGWLPFRFGAWPEMNVITLRRIPSY